MASRQVSKGPARPKFTVEFKADAVAMVIDGERSIADVARSLGLVEQTLGNWVRQARVDRGERAGLTTDERAELVRLRQGRRRPVIRGTFPDRRPPVVSRPPGCCRHQNPLTGTCCGNAQPNLPAPHNRVGTAVWKPYACEPTVRQHDLPAKSGSSCSQPLAARPEDPRRPTTLGRCTGHRCADWGAPHAAPGCRSGRTSPGSSSTPSPTPGALNAPSPTTCARRLPTPPRSASITTGHHDRSPGASRQSRGVRAVRGSHAVTRACHWPSGCCCHPRTTPGMRVSPQVTQHAVPGGGSTPTISGSGSGAGLAGPDRSRSGTPDPVRIPPAMAPVLPARCDIGAVSPGADDPEPWPAGGPV